MENAINEFWPGGPAFYSGRGFSIGTDAVLLYDFAKSIRGTKLCDLGCGSGVIGILLALARPEVHVTGVDILPSAIEAARANALLNGIEGRYSAIAGDLRDPSFLPAGGFDIAVMNPPYFPAGSGKLAADSETAAARSEESCSLSNSCRAAARAVRWGGKFCMVHKPERLAEICCLMHENGLEPKRIRFVQPAPEKAPNLILIESTRGAKPGVQLSAPLVLTDEDGNETAEVRAIYHR